jgi:hypothetical protein
LHRFSSFFIHWLAVRETMSRKGCQENSARNLLSTRAVTRPSIRILPTISRCNSKTKCKNSCYHNDKEDADRETIFNDQVNGATKKGSSHFHGIAFALIQ